jgi:hypothetical protein
MFKFEDINYIKVLYQDDEIQLSQKLAVKRISEKEIFGSAKIEEGLYIKTPLEVVLCVICDDGLYSAKTKLKYIDNQLPFVYFSIENPSEFEYHQNREYFRVPVDYNCKYSFNYNGVIKHFDAQVVDISANGLSIIQSSSCIPTGDVNIEILINSKIIHAKIAYVRTEKKDNQNRLSFKIIEISDFDRDFISKICIQKQIEQRRKD